MTDRRPDPGADALLEHASWVRALALRLARDAAAADDLAQDALVAALVHRPSMDERPLRAWLGTVLRNFARQARRGAQRRSAREAGAARPEAEPSAADLVARAELHRRLMGLVLDLDERERTCVLMRHLEDLPPREIARRLGVPVATVRTRLARARARLRARLDREHGGDRIAWLLACLPLADGGRALTPAALGALWMDAKLKLSLALVSAAAAAFVVVKLAAPADPPPRDPQVAASRPGPREPAAAAPSFDVVAAAGERERIPQRAADAAAAPAASEGPQPTAAGLLRGRVLDASGASLPGVRVVFAPRAGGAGASAASGAGGRFELPAPDGPGVLRAEQPGLATVLSAEYGGRPGAIEPVVVVAPAVDLAGAVVDERGFPLEGARLRVELPEGLRTRIPAVLDHSVVAGWGGASDVAGAFELRGVPALEGARLMADLDGFLPLAQDVPVHDDLALTLVLRVPGEAADLVRGVVLDASGRPAAGARVAYGIETQRAGDEGTFAFQRADAEGLNRRFGVRADLLRALLPGHLPAELECRRGPQGCEWPAWIVLRLGAPALALEGRVLDAAGEPLPGARVWVGDSTTFGAGRSGPVQVESLLAGVDDRPWHYVESDAEGRFALEGLLPRDYTVVAMDEATLLRAEREGVPAGARDVELRMPAEALFPRVAGRVVSHAGEPVPGVTVFPMCDAFRARVQGQIASTSHAGSAPVRTDAEGRFELRDVPRELVYLRVEGEAILPLEYGRHVEGDPRFEGVEPRSLPLERIEDLEIVVALRCHLQVELAAASTADELAVLDEAGRPLELSLLAGGSRREGRRMALVDGRSSVLGVPDTGRVLVLYLAGVEVARVPIELQPGELQTLRL